MKRLGQHKWTQIDGNGLILTDSSLTAAKTLVIWSTCYLILLCCIYSCFRSFMISLWKDEIQGKRSKMQPMPLINPLSQCCNYKCHLKSMLSLYVISKGMSGLHWFVNAKEWGHCNKRAKVNLENWRKSFEGRNIANPSRSRDAKRIAWQNSKNIDCVTRA